MQAELVRSLEAALASPSIPADIVTALLNLAEFMEHNDKSLPLDTRCEFHHILAKCMLHLYCPHSMASILLNDAGSQWVREKVAGGIHC